MIIDFTHVIDNGINSYTLESTIKGKFKIIIAPLKIKNSEGVQVRIFGFI